MTYICNYALNYGNFTNFCVNQKKKMESNEQNYNLYTADFKFKFVRKHS